MDPRDREVLEDIAGLIALVLFSVGLPFLLAVFFG